MSVLRWARRTPLHSATSSATAGQVVPPNDDEPATESPDAGYEKFKLVLDEPASNPGLGFGEYAAALTDLITRSRAEFAIGIFGGWGSGKTTLMEAIKRQLREHPSVVPVWFSAWRYEREPNLLLPLLDVLREALEEKSKTDGAGTWGRAAKAVAQAGYALLRGVTVKAAFPGGEIDVDFDKSTAAYQAAREPAGPLSPYHQGFRLLQQAIKGLSGGGARRVVIFVDDLDRCMPLNALDVLESMKLFFDVEGCIFVVGLDQDIAERAVAVKYRTTTGDDPGVNGTKYVKKMFQVHFALPSERPHQVADYLNSIQTSANFGFAQLDNFDNIVRPHILQALSDGGPVNPRELKRLINLYTLQAKILSRRQGESFKPAVLLALLLMSSRSDWEPIYVQLAADSAYVQSALNSALTREPWPDEVSLSSNTFRLPPQLAEYLRGPAADLLTVPGLQAYILAAESATSTDPSVVRARTIVSQLQRQGDQLAAGKVSVPRAQREVAMDVDALHKLIHSRRDSFGRLDVLRERLTAAVDQLARAVHDMDSTTDSSQAFVRWWGEEGRALLKALDGDLYEWHRYV